MELEDLGWGDRPLPDHPHLHARVVRAERTAVRALGPSGQTVLTLDRALPTTPVTGDWVRHDGDRVVAVVPRRTALRRTSAGGTSDEQVLAADVDTVGVVVATPGPGHPEPDLGRVEQLLAVAWSSGATPLVVVTKADLGVGDLPARLAGAAPGVDVVVTSRDDATALLPHLGRGRTLVLVGSSGAGKSTLGNTLAGEQLLATGAVRASDGEGRHTTAWRELVLLPGDRGLLLDTPGLRELHLAGGADVDAVFTDVLDLAQACRFRDCAHVSEPGCAVLAAVEDGTLDGRRLASWRKLGREQAWAEARRDHGLRQAQLAVWKQRTKEARGRTRP